MCKESRYFQSKPEFQPHKISATISKDISLCSLITSTSFSPSLEKMNLFSYLYIGLTVGCVHSLECVHKFLTGRRDAEPFFFYCLEVVVTEDAILQDPVSVVCV